jgi:Fe-S oxidoreductase/nitrate reductase gamma subunit
MTTKAAEKETRRLKISSDQIKTGLGDFFIHILGQVRILKKAYPGVMHFLIFWGMLMLLIGHVVDFWQMGLFLPFNDEYAFLKGGAYFVFEVLTETAGVALLLGLFLAFFRRAVLRPKSLDTQWDDYYAIFTLAIIPIWGYINEGIRIVATSPVWANYTYIGNLLAGWFQNWGLTPGVAENGHSLVVYGHAIIGLVFVASIPFTKLRHLIMTPIHILFRNRKDVGTLEKIENIEEAELLGVGKAEEFKTIQLLSFDACLRCGRCEDVCPATASGMAYSPKDLIQHLRTAMEKSLIGPNGNSEKEILGEYLNAEYPWACTTCGACLQKCPAFIHHVDNIVDLRRFLVLTTGQIPKSVGDTLRNMERQGNPWGMPPQERTKWAQDLGIRELQPGEETDVLLYLGCAFAYDERNKKVAHAFARLLQKYEVDFAILGMDETCCGETARRLGHEYVFQVMAEQNIEIFSEFKFNRIVTQCPHCFNTLKKEYPQFGADLNVQHYTEFLQELLPQIAQTEPNGTGIQGNLVYHDSCYLGRYNDIYNEPRALLDSMKVSRREMANNHGEGFCCGGGGGQMWMETDANTRINHKRLEDALSAQADVVATACPYCLQMFDDAIRSKGIGEKIQVMDIAEVLIRQVDS